MKAITRALLKRLSHAARPYLKSYGLLQVSGVFNRSALVWQPGNEKVLVLAPHMDDETIGCGGALALHALRGAAITAVFLTDGRNGSSEVARLQGGELVRRQRELVSVRKQEAREALDTLGVQGMVCLEAADGELERCDWIATRLQALLLEARPQLVYLPFFLEEHPDHRAVSRILLDATSNTALDFKCLGYEVWTPLFPNCFVDIRETIAIKKAAIGAYRSQLAQADYLHTAVGMNAYRSAALIDGRNGYAEAFHVASLAEYREQYARYCAEP